MERATKFELVVNLKTVELFTANGSYPEIWASNSSGKVRP